LYFNRFRWRGMLSSNRRVIRVKVRNIYNIVDSERLW
jgi:hypothetical protein